jgi:dihydrofolate reductase
VLLTAVVAVTENDVTGRDNGMPWHLPADLKHFKAVTLGKPVLMGRKTFESIGKPLPGRRNLVLTQAREFAAPGVEVVHSLEEAISAARACTRVSPAMCTSRRCRRRNGKKWRAASGVRRTHTTPAT